VQLVLVVAGAAIGVSFGLVGAAWGVFAAYWLSYIVCLALVERLLGARWWEVVVIHLKAFAVVAPSVLLARAARSAIGDHGVALQLVPAAVFALAAAIVLGFGPAALVTGDLVRARGHAWGWLSPRLPGRRNPDAA
jgi:hypothetical protein